MLTTDEQAWVTIKPADRRAWVRLSPTASPAYVLEDHAGLPIECPLCGCADVWRLERAALGGAPRAFVCSHSVTDRHGGTTRWTATVTADQVGGYLDPATLLSTAA